MDYFLYTFCNSSKSFTKLHHKWRNKLVKLYCEGGLKCRDIIKWGWMHEVASLELNLEWLFLNLPTYQIRSRKFYIDRVGQLLMWIRRIGINTSYFSISLWKYKMLTVHTFPLFVGRTIFFSQEMKENFLSKSHSPWKKFERKRLERN